jgi:hypothetical protein
MGSRRLHAAFAAVVIAASAVACSESDSGDMPGTTPKPNVTLNSTTAVKYRYKPKNGKPPKFREIVKGNVVDGKCQLAYGWERHRELVPVMVEADLTTCEAVVEFGPWDDPNEKRDTARAKPLSDKSHRLSMLTSRKRVSWRGVA